MDVQLGGGCHCGAVRFKVQLDPAVVETSRCNCSICLKARFWKAVVPAGAFQLEQGERELSEYKFGAKRISHRFCSICGVKVFGRVAIDGEDMVAINVACFENLSDAAFASFVLVYQNGRDDDYEHAPSRTSFL